MGKKQGPRKKEAEGNSLDPRQQKNEPRQRVEDQNGQPSQPQNEDQNQTEEDEQQLDKDELSTVISVIGDKINQCQDGCERSNLEKIQAKLKSRLKSYEDVDDMSRLREMKKIYDHDNKEIELLEDERRILECEGFKYEITGKEEGGQGLLQGRCLFSSSSKYSSTIDVTLVKYKDKRKAKKLFNKLETLKNRFMVKARYLKEEKDQSIIFIEGAMCSLDTWMNKKKDDCIKKFGEGFKDHWWNFIQHDFKKIFRNVIHGIWCFYDINIYFVNFLSGILVDNSGNAKLLPSLSCLNGMSKDEKDKNIVLRLREAMVKIICVDGGRNVSEFGLPYDLESSFEFLDPEKLKILPCKWLINSSFVWETSQNIRFVDKLHELVDRDMINKYDAEEAINSACTDVQDADLMIHDFVRIHNVEDLHAKVLTWVKEVKKPGRNGRKDTIFSSVFSFNSVIAKDGTRVSHYDTEIDLGIYLHNFIKHHNDNRYKAYHGKKLEKTKIAEKLRQRLPNAYANICIVLYLYALGGMWEFKDKAIEELVGCFDSS